MNVKDISKDKLANLKDKTIIVYDNGLFIELAIELSKAFKKVYYYMPWKNGFPKSNQYVVGQGIPEIERIYDFFDYVEKADLFVFPDVYDGDLQLYLEKQGKLVWGARKGEEMELYRDKMKDHMKKLGLYVTPYKVIKGLAALREHLKKNDKQYVKINKTRGDMETFRSENYKLIEPVLDELEHNLGALKYIKEFIVEDALDDTEDDHCVESGCDLYTVNGKFPSHTLAGIEVKDLGYCGRILPYNKLSTKITDFNKAIAPTLKAYGYKGFLSTELRISEKHDPYMLDQCSRAGSPPNELYQLMYKNLPEIVWYGAQGILIDPEYDYEYGVEALIHSSWADKNWQAVYFPEKYRENIKLRNVCKIEGKYYCVPQAVGLPEIGAVVAEGKTLDEAIALAKEIAASIEGHYIEVKLESIDKALEEFEKLEKMGVKII
jgi:predicted RNase H-like HicB family nuclease